MQDLALARRAKALELGKPYGLTEEAAAALPLTVLSEDSVKGISVVSRRVCSGYFALELARALSADEWDSEARTAVREAAKTYGVDYDMTPRETAMLYGNISSRDLRNITGSGETLGVLVWMTGGAQMPVDPAKAMADGVLKRAVIDEGHNIQHFIEIARLATAEEVLTLLDLYRLYAAQGLGESSIVEARRRALEWLVVREPDWFRLTF